VSEGPEYPQRRGEPSPWEARWSLPRTRPFSARDHPFLRGVVVLAVAVAVIVVADAVLSGPVVGWIALVAILGALAFLRF
jgi:hypothetical protein